MLQRALIIAAVMLVQYEEGTCNQYAIGDIRNCPLTQPTVDNASRLLRMEVLPGLGFDNLRNVELSQVLSYNYSLCKITNDGLYLLPDNVFVEPKRRSTLDVYAQLIGHWNEYKSMTAMSINAEASVYSLVDGKFSTEFKHVKSNQVVHNGKTMRVQVRHKLYSVRAQPDSQLHPRFKNRLLDIAASLQNNNTAEAEYLAEMLVREYGTHVIKGADAGAVLAQIDTVSANSSSKGKDNLFSISASASVNFFKKFSISAGAGFSTGTVNVTRYLESQSSSRVLTIGGPPFRPNMTVEEWQDGVPNSLVAIDRVGDPLHYVISSQTLPELPMPTLYQLVDQVYQSIVRYYQVNTHYGCTNSDSPNFNYQANIDDGSCQASQTNYSFGGVYQTCTSADSNSSNFCLEGVQQLNPLTGKLSCPRGYKPVLLYKGMTTRVHQKKVCKDVCSKCGWLGWKRCCKCMSATANVLLSAHYEAYWCTAEETTTQQSGYMLGGMYTTKTINPVTRAMSCPSLFYPLRLLSDSQVCVSDEFELAAGYAVPFGGFFSCLSGNPLAAAGSKATNTKKCPNGYTRKLVTIEEGCGIDYCAKFKVDMSSKPPQLPPFQSKPSLKLNISQTLVIQGPYGSIWTRSEEGNWEKEDNGMMTGDKLLEVLQNGQSRPGSHPSENSDGEISPVVSAVISCACTLLVCTVIAGLVFFTTIAIMRKKIKRRKIGAYLEIGGSSESNGASHSDVAENKA